MSPYVASYDTDNSEGVDYASRSPYYRTWPHCSESQQVIHVYNRLKHDSDLPVPMWKLCTRLTIEATWFAGFLLLGLVAWFKIYSSLVKP